jgi:hypothetical protein
MIKVIERKPLYEGFKHLLALLSGVMVWSLFKVITNSQDPTAEIVYWKVGYPISILLSGILGILFPERPWRWAFYVIWSQFCLGLITHKGDLNLLPPGVIVYMFLTIPCILSGQIGAWTIRSVRRKRTKETS